MLKICGDSIYKLLEAILSKAHLTGVLPSESKKGSMVPVHNKVTSMILKIIVQFLSFPFAVKSLKD